MTSIMYDPMYRKLFELLSHPLVLFIAGLYASMLVACLWERLFVRWKHHGVVVFIATLTVLTWGYMEWTGYTPDPDCVHEYRHSC